MKTYTPKKLISVLAVAVITLFAQTPVHVANASFLASEAVTTSQGQQNFLAETYGFAAASDTGYTIAQVAANNTKANCWTIVSDLVYNITSYVNSHPGGANSISKLCGKDGTSIFNNIHGGSPTQTNILASYKIGVLSKPLIPSCSAGSFYDVALSKCTQAPKGYFVLEASSAAGIAAATPCPIGKFSSVTGSTQCLPAPPGFYVDTQANTEAKPCPQGYFSSLSESKICQIAPKGFYAAGTANPTASACAKGFTTASSGSTTPSSCYKPITQTVTNFIAPKAMKFGSSTNLAITTNSDALAKYKVTGPCTAKIASVVTTVKGKNLITKKLQISAAKKSGACSITLSSSAFGKYLAFVKTIVIKVSASGK